MSNSKPKSLRFIEELVGDFQFTDVYLSVCLAGKFKEQTSRMAISCTFRHFSEVL